MPKFIISLVAGFALALSSYCFSEESSPTYTVSESTAEQKEPENSN
ncbi:hypothetical protein [Sphingobacterium paludis]|nr:hypothetical protein [Sphingobacterium paludis]